MNFQYPTFNFKKSKSFTLTEVLITIFLVSVIFLGIFGAYQLGLKVVGLSERKITATQNCSRRN